MHIEVL